MKLLGALPQNSRVCILVEPLWTLFGPITFFYGSLYMKQVGLSEISIGWVSSLNLAVSCFCFFIAGPLTNRLGRKRATFYFDIIAWPLSMLIWAFSQDIWLFLVAATTNACSRITVVSWNLFMTEDAEQGQRIRIFAIINIILGAGGFATMGAGFLTGSYGLVPVMRAVYLVGCLSMLLMVVIRHFTTTETRIGAAILQDPQRLGLGAGMRAQLVSFRDEIRRPQFLKVTLLYAIIFSILSMTNFQSIFVSDALGYSSVEVALVPGVNALLTVLIILFVLPRLRPKSEFIGLSITFLLLLASFVLYALIPRMSLWFLLSASGLVAAALQLAQSLRESAFMRVSTESGRAELFGLTQTLGLLVSIPSGVLAGALYTFHPALPFLFAAVLSGLAVLLSVSLQRGVDDHEV
jgi:MFS family permease